MSLSRRSMLGASAVATSAAFGTSVFAAQASAALPQVFGPAIGEARLNRNENPYGPAPSAIRAMAQTASMACYYPEGPARALTETIAQSYGLPTDHVLMGNGSTEILVATAQAWGQDGAIICPELFWDTTVGFAVDKGATARRVALDSAMQIDLEATEAAIGSDGALVHICNPNNPTGVALDGDALRAFIRKVGPKVTVLVDEAYMELADDPAYSTVVDLIHEGENVMVARTFSKIYGMAGLRVGYLLAAPDKIERVRRYIVPFSLNEAGASAALASFKDESFKSFSRGKVLEAKGLLLDAVKSAGVTALPSQTNFLYVNVPDANRLQKAMAAQNISIRPAYGKWVNWSRVSTGRIEDVERYASALAGALKV